MPFSANVDKLTPSATIAVSTLARRLAAEGRDIINLSAGEPDFDTPDFVSRAAIEGIRNGGTRYTPPAGLPELRRAIAAHLSARAGRDLPWEGVVVTAGVKQALFNAAFTLFGPGDEVAIAAPYWTTYPTLVDLARAEPVPVFGRREAGFKVSPRDLERACGPGTAGLVINTPSNPTGAVYTVDELAEIAAWCRERDVVLISDEIYRSIHHDGDEPAPGILDLPEGSLGRHVLVDGASKSWAMTGWRVGFSFSDTAVADKMTALQSQLTSNTATPSQLAALEAYSNREASAEAQSRMGAAFRRRRDLVCARFAELLPEIPIVRPSGAFYVFFDVSGLFDAECDNATDWCAKLLQERGVALVPGAAFGDDRWVRLSFATSDEVLEEALARIASFVREPVGS